MTITGLTRKTVMTIPFTAPAASPARTPPATPATALVLAPTASAETTDDSPAMEPTEMSRPPVMRTTAWPTATRPTIATACPMFSRFCGRRIEVVCM